MWHGTESFLHYQALLGDGQIHAAPYAFASESEIIPIGIVAEQRKSEAILAAGGTVTRTRVAPGLHKDRHDIELKADGAFECSMLDAHRNSECAAAIFD